MNEPIIGSATAESSSFGAPSRGYRLAAALAGIVALTALIASFCVPRPHEIVTSQGSIGAVSTTVGTSVGTGSPVFASQSHTVDMEVRFTPLTLSRRATVFQEGLPFSGLAGVVTGGQGAPYSFSVNTTLSNGRRVALTLISKLTPGQPHTVRIVEQGGRRLEGWADGRRVFAFDDGHDLLEPTMGTLWLGEGYAGTHPFSGSVSLAHFNYEFTSVVGSPVLQRALWLISGISAGGVLVILLVLLVFTLASRGDSSRPTRRPSAHKGPWRNRRSNLWAGGSLVVLGVALVGLLTPPDNVALRKVGFDKLSFARVVGSRPTTIDLAGESGIFATATTLDVSLTCAIKLAAPSASGSPPFLSTGHGLSGMSFGLGGPRGLNGTVGARPGTIGPVAFVLSTDLPMHRWIQVSASILRNQSVGLEVNGHSVQSFTWDQPVLSPSFRSLSFDLPPNLQLRDAVLVVRLYGNQSTVVAGLTRMGQLAGLLALLLGAILLFGRFSSGLVPRIRTKRPLVIAAFGTMGVATLANMLIDSLRLQRSPGFGIARNSWIFARPPRFSDFFQIYESLRSLNPYGIRQGSYPPMGYWLVAPFAWLSEYAAFFVCFTLALGFLIWWFNRAFASELHRWERPAVILTGMLSLPVTFAFDRGNIDVLLMIGLVLALAALEMHRDRLSSGIIALLAAAKIFPGLFFALLIKRARWRRAAVGIASGLLATLVGFALFHGGVTHNLGALVKNLSTVESVQSLGQQISYNASIYAWIGAGMDLIYGPASLTALHHVFTHIATPVEALGGIAVAVFVWKKERTLWRATAVITIYVILFSPLSYYYALIFLFVPLALFVRDAPPSPRSITIACLLGFVLAPRAYFYVSGSTDTSVLLTAPLLCATLVLVVQDGMRERRRSHSLSDDHGLHRPTELTTTMYDSRA